MRNQSKFEIGQWVVDKDNNLFKIIAIIENKDLCLDAVAILRGEVGDILRGTICLNNGFSLAESPYTKNTVSKSKAPKQLLHKGCLGQIEVFKPNNYGMCQTCGIEGFFRQEKSAKDCKEVNFSHTGDTFQAGDTFKVADFTKITTRRK